MGKKLTYTYVSSAFDAKGYTLLSKDYINSTKKLEYLCPNGHKHNITFRDFSQGHGCPFCTNQAKPTIEYIKFKFREVGYTLLSKVYINSKASLNYKCNSGHTHNVTWNGFQQGTRCPSCASLSRSGNKSYLWKGGVTKANLALYKTHAHKLEKYHKVYKIKKDDLNLLGVHCMYCDQIFIPTWQAVKTRYAVILGNISGEQAFYCSDNCKKDCPTYWRVNYPKGFKLATSREVQPALRKLVLARDNYKCQKCGKGVEETQLHCHHIDPVINNPIESADLDNCITLCITCHKDIHTSSGCGYSDLKCT